MVAGGIVKESSPQSEISFPTSLNPGLGGANQDLNAFLAKPIIMVDKNFSTGDGMTTFFADTVTIFSDIVVKDMIYSKVKGFLAMRATCVFTLQCTAHQYQQGRYLLCYCPTGGADTTTIQTAQHHHAHRFTIMQCTQLPHVEFDLSTDSEVNLRIPFVSAEYGFPIAACNTTPKFGNTGYVFIVPYSALDTGSGSTTAGFTLWHHFEDVELYGPTVPQMAPYNPSNKKLLTETEQTKNRIGPISSVLGAFSKASSAFTAIPLLSPFAGTAGWALDIAAGTASAFGYSKPRIELPTTQVKQLENNGIQNMDGTDNVQSLGLCSSTAVSSLPSFADCDIDELSFNYIKSRKAYYDSIVWSAATSGNTIITGFPVRPSTFTTSSADDGNTVVNFTPIAYVDRFFSYWRGSIVITVKIIKTQYHSGRLLFLFQPFDVRFPAPLMSIDKSAYIHRTIVDIRETDEITFTIPYISDAPYMRQLDETGQFQIWILDQLKAPTLVAQQVVLKLEVHAGEDMEWFGPQTFTDIPYYPSAPQMATYDPNATSPMTIGGATEIQQDFSQYCVGERVNSFRELLKVYNCLVNQSPNTGESITLFPYFAPTCHYGSTGVVHYGYIRPDLYTHMCSIFLLSRGSVKYRIIQDRDTAYYSNNIAPAANAFSTNYRSVIVTEILPKTETVSDMIEPIAAHSTMLRLRGISIQNPMKSGADEFLVPSYNRYPSRINSEQTYRRVPYALSSIHGPDITVYRESNVNTGVSGTKLYRSSAEDIDFGFFISIPPLWFPNTA